jgi:hypothetical protein
MGTREKIARSVLLTVSLVGSFALVTAAAWAGQSRIAGWADTNCVFDPYSTQVSTTYKRDSALQIARIAVWEGYHWGGGCYNDDDRDNTPNEPVQSEWTHGEGPDCSGLVWRIWRLHRPYSAPPGQNPKLFWLWYRWLYEHGPFNTAAFKAGTDATVSYAKSGLIKADALVRDVGGSGHMAAVVKRLDDGSDEVIEAKGEAYGVLDTVRRYRAQAEYSGARRLGWTG